MSAESTPVSKNCIFRQKSPRFELSGTIKVFPMNSSAKQEGEIVGINDRVELGRVVGVDVGLTDGIKDGLVDGRKLD